MYRKHDEDFLKNIVGNYSDYIRNLVFGMQKYIDKFYSHTSEIFLSINKIEDPTMRQILHYLSVESENILRNKGVMFAIESFNLVVKKYDRLASNIINGGDDVRYNVYVDAYKYLDEFQDDINWKLFSMNEYTKDKTAIDELLDFENHMEDKFNTFSNIKFEKIYCGLNKKEMMDVLGRGFNKLHSTLLHLKNLAENSSSLYSTVIITRKIVSLLVLSCCIISTIEMYEN